MDLNGRVHKRIKRRRNDFSRLYNKLENSIYLDRVSASSFMTEEEAHVVYENNEHKVELIAKFEEPEYYNIVIH